MRWHSPGGMWGVDDDCCERRSQKRSYVISILMWYHTTALVHIDYIEEIFYHNVLGSGAPQTICVLTVRDIASQTQTVREAAITSVGPPA